MRLRTLLIASAAALISGALVAQAQVPAPGVNSTLNAVWSYIYEASSLKPTYSATSAAISPASSATDICGITGSASKTIRVRRVIVAGSASTNMLEPVAIYKRSTETTGGGSGLTAVPYDSQSAAATAIVDVWTTNPTVGTPVGMLIDRLVNLQAVTGTNNPGIDFKFGELGSAVVLRGAAQSLDVNLNGLTLSGASLTCTFEWTEESQP